MIGANAEKATENMMSIMANADDIAAGGGMGGGSDLMSVMMAISTNMESIEANSAAIDTTMMGLSTNTDKINANMMSIMTNTDDISTTMESL